MLDFWTKNKWGDYRAISPVRKGLKQWGQIFVQSYGMTETAPALTMLLKSDHIVDGTADQVHRLILRLCPLFS
jgi:hypothetical protein